MLIDSGIWPQYLNPSRNSELTAPYAAGIWAERLPGGSSRYGGIDSVGMRPDIHRSASLDPLGTDLGAQDPPQESRSRADAERGAPAFGRPRSAVRRRWRRVRCRRSPFPGLPGCLSSSCQGMMQRDRVMRVWRIMRVNGGSGRNE